MTHIDSFIEFDKFYAPMINATVISFYECENLCMLKLELI